MSESRSSFGGLGAVFFLAAFGAIAFFVQRQTIPDSRDELRKPVTVVTDEVDDEAPAPVPWEDRVALDAMQLTPIGVAGSPAENENENQENPPGADLGDRAHIHKVANRRCQQGAARAGVEQAEARLHLGQPAEAFGLYEMADLEDGRGRRHLGPHRQLP